MFNECITSDKELGKGCPSVIFDNSGRKLMDYIREWQLMPISHGYNVTMNQPKNQQHIESLIEDIQTIIYEICFANGAWVLCLITIAKRIVHNYHWLKVTYTS